VAPLKKRGNRLAIAVADPTNLRALDEVRFQTGLQVDPIVVEVDKLTQLLVKLAENVETTLNEFSQDNIDLEAEVALEGEKQEDASQMEVDDAPVVRFIQKILLDAITEGASDVHFEPYEKYYRIRYRTDGILREIAQPPLVLKEKIAARIKVISRLDISKSACPRTGASSSCSPRTAPSTFASAPCPRCTARRS